MQLPANSIHIWSTELTLTTEQENEKWALLSADERERALRFHFPLHKQRFIAARAGLRHILGLYLQVSPASVTFGYTELKKPFLQSPTFLPIQFNLAHSDNMAVYAFTLHHAIGVDVEKIQAEHHLDIAERYFSEQENAALKQMSDQDQRLAFYQLWSRKEALVKAIGKGLMLPLSSFTVSPSSIAETVMAEKSAWSLQSLSIHPDYAAAMACSHTIENVIYWKLFAHGHSGAG